ncbi:Uncharacterised protein [Actinobacillus equuli]|nr:Uncharacterised protein [Actinobacillus equuli]
MSATINTVRENKEEYNLNSKFLVYERDMLLPDEFEYYMLKLAKNLKESLFFRELSHVQLDSVTQETVFSYDLETAFKFIEKKGDRLNIISLMIMWLTFVLLNIKIIF